MCEPHERDTMSRAPRDASSHVSRQPGGVTVRPALRRRAFSRALSPLAPPSALNLQVRAQPSTWQVHCRAPPHLDLVKPPLFWTYPDAIPA